MTCGMTTYIYIYAYILYNRKSSYKDVNLK